MSIEKSKKFSITKPRHFLSLNAFTLGIFVVYIMCPDSLPQKSLMLLFLAHIPFHFILTSVIIESVIAQALHLLLLKYRPEHCSTKARLSERYARIVK